MKALFFTPRPAGCAAAGSALTLASSLLLAACSSTAPDLPPPISMVLSTPPSASPIIDSRSTNLLCLEEALLYALQTDMRLSEISIQARRLAGDAASIQPMSPEIRLSRDQGRSDRRDWSSSKQSTQTQRTGSDRTTGNTTQFTEENRMSHVDSGDPFDPDRVQTDTSSGVEHARSTESGSSRSHSVGTQASTSNGHLREEEDGMSLELRLRLPNPWQLSSARSAARASQAMTETELVQRERWLACDIAAAAARLHFMRRMQSLRRDFQRSVVTGQERIHRAFLQGALTAADYADNCRFFASAVADEQRTSIRVIELEQDWRRLTGLDPDRVRLAELESAPIWPLDVPTNSAADAAWAAQVAQAHPAVLLSRSNLRRCASEWRETRARTMPWPAFLAAGYGWWDGEGDGLQTFERSGYETRTGTSSSTELEFEVSRSQNSEMESPTGDRTSTAERGRQTTVSSSSSTETGKEASTGSGSEKSRRNDDGTEWWVVLGIEVPIFEWFSSEGKRRALAVGTAQEMTERLLARIHHDILTTLEFARKSQLAAQQARERLTQSDDILKRIPVQSRTQGIASELAAMRVDASMLELSILQLDSALQDILTRNELARCAGLFPRFSTPSNAGTQADRSPVAPARPN